MILKFTASTLILFTVIFACSRDVVIVSVESITLNATVAALDLNANKSVTLTATVAPVDATDPSVTWSSSDNNVASVSFNAANPAQATVTAVSSGTVTITAKSTDNPGITAICTVTVNTPVVGISFNKQNLDLAKIGDSETLIVIFNPDNASKKEVTWASGNANIAEVDQSGKVTAKALGTTSITATTTDGTNRTATCAVTVGTSATAVTLNESTIELTKSQTFTLIASVWPETTSNKAVTWTSSNSTIASVNTNGVVTANASGTAIITA
ncbi:MAG: Ig-like domain-containing protein, partial [Tannerella sp.]|nr:Ig-like domain-containing protein [Tannerella sp.]